MQQFTYKFFYIAVFFITCTLHLSAQQTTEIKLSQQADDSLRIDLTMFHVNVFYFTDSIRVLDDSIFMYVCFTPLDAPSVTTYDHTRIVHLVEGDYHFSYASTIDPDCYGNSIHESVSEDFSFPLDNTVDVIAALDLQPLLEEAQLLISNISQGNFFLKQELTSEQDLKVISMDGSILEFEHSTISFNLESFPSGNYFVMIITEGRARVQVITKL